MFKQYMFFVHCPTLNFDFQDCPIYSQINFNHILKYDDDGVVNALLLKCVI